MLARIMPLAMAYTNENIKIVGLNGGHGLSQRLADMGLVPGQTIKVIYNYIPGPIMVGLNGSKIALGCGVAQKIMVEKTE